MTIADESPGPDAGKHREKVFGIGSAGKIAGASAVAAASVFLVQVISTRTLPVESNHEFLVYWSVLFGVLGIVGGIQNETTRAVAATRVQSVRPAAGSAKGTPVLLGAVIWGGVIGLGVLASSPLWAPRLVPSTMPGVVVLIAAGAVLYACHSALAGAFSGRAEWSCFAGLMTVESVTRLCLVGLAAVVVSQSLAGMEIAAASALLVWIGFSALSARGRAAISSSTPVGLRTLLGNYGYAIASSAASAVLITGYPALLSLVVGDSAPPALVASVILGVSITRSPLLIPLQAFQGVAISAFVKSGGGSLRGLIKPLLTLLVLGIVGAVLAGLIGPFLMQLIFGDAYQLRGVTLAALTLAAVSLAWLTLTGTATIAVSSHAGYMIGWIAAVAGTFALLLVPQPVEARAAVSLSLGPLLGVITHLVAIRHKVRSPSG